MHVHTMPVSNMFLEFNVCWRSIEQRGGMPEVGTCQPMGPILKAVGMFYKGGKLCPWWFLLPRSRRNVISPHSTPHVSWKERENTLLHTFAFTVREVHATYLNPSFGGFTPIFGHTQPVDFNRYGSFMKLFRTEVYCWVYHTSPQYISADSEGHGTRVAECFNWLLAHHHGSGINGINRLFGCFPKWWFP